MLKATDTSRSHLTNLYSLLFLVVSLLKGTSHSLASCRPGECGTSHHYIGTVQNLHFLFKRGVHVCKKNVW